MRIRHGRNLLASVSRCTSATVLSWCSLAALTIELAALPLAYRPPSHPWEWSRVEVSDSFRPSARQGHAAVEVGQHVYIFGGCEQSVRCYNDIWTFDTDSLRWQQEAQQGERPEPRAGHMAILAGTGIFVYGGANSRETFGCVFKYDLIKRHWTRAVSHFANDLVGPGRRTNHAAALDAQGRIYVFGGYSREGQFLNDLWILGVSEGLSKAYTPNGQLHVTWLKPLSTGIMPEPRESHTMTIVDRKLVLFGGYAASGKALNELHVYDLDASSWSTPQMACAPPPPRQGHSAVRHGHELIVAGGCSAKDGQPVCQSDVWSLDLKLMRWTKQATDSITWSPREGHSATFVRGRMFTYGGCLLGAECYSDIAALDTFTPCPASCGGHGQCMRSCDGNGACNQDLFCRCMDHGFSGHDCLQPVTCLEDCGTHGVCGEDGECQCENGWSGVGCATELACPGALAKCSGQGTCMMNHSCQCLAGFTGPDCALAITFLQQHAECPSGCCGHGTCMGGDCQCTPGWYGIACAISEPVWQSMQRQKLAEREQLLKQAQAKRAQAGKSTQLAESLTQTWQKPSLGGGRVWVRPEAQVEVMQLRRDTQALTAAAEAAEAQAASVGMDQPELLATTCAIDSVHSPSAAVSMTAPSAARLRASRKGFLPSILAAYNSVAPPAKEPAGLPKDFGIGSVANVGHGYGCTNNCNFQGVCEQGVCFCQPSFYGEACGDFRDASILTGFAKIVIFAIVVVGAAIYLSLRSSKP